MQAQECLTTSRTQPISVQGPKGGLRSMGGGPHNGKTYTGEGQGRRCELRSMCLWLGQVLNTAPLSAATSTWGQDYGLGDLTRA